MLKVKTDLLIVVYNVKTNKWSSSSFTVQQQLWRPRLSERLSERLCERLCERPAGLRSCRPPGRPSPQRGPRAKPRTLGWRCTSRNPRWWRQRRWCTGLKTKGQTPDADVTHKFETKNSAYFHVKGRYLAFPDFQMLKTDLAHREIEDYVEQLMTLFWDLG